METVKITNLTDHPDHNTMIIDIYNGSLGPGESANIPKDLVDGKIMELAKHKFVSVGGVPLWYTEWKNPPQLTQADLIRESIKKDIEADELLKEAQKSFEEPSVAPKKKGK